MGGSMNDSLLVCQHTKTTAEDPPLHRGYVPLFSLEDFGTGGHVADCDSGSATKRNVVILKNNSIFFFEKK